MSEDRDPRPNHEPVDQAGVRQRVPPPMVVWVFVVLGLLMLAAVGWAVFGD